MAEPPAAPSFQTAASPPGAGIIEILGVEVTQSRYGHWEYYFSVRAVEAPGYRFKFFIGYLADGTPNGNIIDGEGENTGIVYNVVGEDGEPWLERNTVRLVAYFESTEPTGTIRVTTYTSPQNAGMTSGGGLYELGDECEIATAPKCSPWTFDHWELSTGESSSSRAYRFTVRESVNCIAHYKHTNTRMPYDDGGNILCDASGRILYDGNLITA